MTHRNAPLTVLGRQRAVTQVIARGRPIAHVAAEFHIARATLSKWVGRYRAAGAAGLEDCSSAPVNRPPRLSVEVIELIEHWRKIPDGGGWRVHGPGSEKALASNRSHRQKVGYTYLHSIFDGFSRLTYTEALEDETAATTITFFHRARAFFAEHGITRISRLVTDNGKNYTAKAFRRSTCAFVGRHQRTRIYTPRHNGKVERFQRITAEEFLYDEVFTSEQERRNRHGVWLHHYNYHRPRTACGDQPPASRLHATVMTNYN